MDSVVEIACKRNPLLALCKAALPIEPSSSLDQKVEPLSVQISNVFNDKNTAISPNLTTTTVSTLDTKDKNNNESAVEGSENPEIIDDKGAEIASKNESTEVSDDRRDHETLLKNIKEEYCQKFIPKYNFYCQGPGRYTVSEKDQNRLTVFCLSVRENCLPVG